MVNIYYLFYDLESGNEHDGLGGICSFGYVLTNDSFDILESDDIIINPELKKWDWYALKNILPYKKDCYEQMSNFPKAYDKIKRLFALDDLIVINHAIGNDIILLEQTCKRYKLELFNYAYYDSCELYRKIKGRKNHDNLDTISKEVCGLEERKSHTSLDDAERVYLIMKTLCFDEQTSLVNLFEKYGFKAKRTTDIDERNIIDFKNNKTHDSNNNRLFNKWIKRTKIKKDIESEYNGLSFSISSDYENHHFKEMLFIISLSAKLGMKYSIKPSECDIFATVKDDNSSRARSINEAKENGKEIKIIDINDFLKIIGYKEEKVIEHFYKVMERWHYYKLINED